MQNILLFTGSARLDQFLAKNSNPFRIRRLHRVSWHILMVQFLGVSTDHEVLGKLLK